MSIASRRAREARRSRLAIVVAFIAISVLWIAGSDRLLERVAPGSVELQTLKGTLYVLATAAFVWLLMFVRDVRLDRRSDRLAASEQRTSRAESHLQAALGASPLAIVTTDLEGIVTDWNPSAERLFGWSGPDVVGRELPMVAAGDRPKLAAWLGQIAAGSTEPELRRSCFRADGMEIVCRFTVGVIRDDEGSPTGFQAMVVDLTEPIHREEWNHRLRRAIDHAAESVVITDLGGTITYVNPAFETVSGYPAAELLGQSPRILKSGLMPPSTYADLWGHLLAGETWRGILVNRRRDGSLYEEDATISPVLGSDGRPNAYVGVKRDLTLERRLAAGLRTELMDRAAVEEAMARIEVRGTAEETAQEACDALAAFGDLDDVWLLYLPPERSLVVPIACVASTQPIHLGEPIDGGRAAYIRERAIGGPWSDNHIEGMLDPRIDVPALAGTVTVSAPLRHRGRTVAVLVASARTSAPDPWIARHQRVISALATHVGPLLGPQLETHDLGSVNADEIQRIVDEAAFTPVFQPVCDLVTRQPVGWEAYTRFADGTAPHQRFADARAVGLGAVLEVACGQRAVEAFAAQDRPGWLSINVSPFLVLSGQAARIVTPAGREVVLELTDSVDLDDYARLRGAIELLDPPALLAVDDPGTGYASLRHVLELRPDFIKLGAALVHGFDRDEGRQARVAGMVRYAHEHDTQLIAEGVETEAERATLVRLGVPFGQGYLLGVPSISGDVAPASARRSRRLRAVSSDEDRAAAG